MKTYRKETFLISSICTLFLFILLSLSISSASNHGVSGNSETNATVRLEGGEVSLCSPESVDFGKIKRSSQLQTLEVTLGNPDYFCVGDTIGEGGYFATLQISALKDGEEELKITSSNLKIDNGSINVLEGEIDGSISVPDGAKDFISFSEDHPAIVFERKLAPNEGLGELGVYGILPTMQLNIGSTLGLRGGNYSGIITFTIIEDSSLAYASCNELLDNYPSLTSGVYTINPNGSEEFEVYCDMETDGGGWTLIARQYKIAYTILKAGTKNDSDNWYYGHVIGGSDVLAKAYGNNTQETFTVSSVDLVNGGNWSNSNGEFFDVSKDRKGCDKNTNIPNNYQISVTSSNTFLNINPKTDCSGSSSPVVYLGTKGTTDQGCVQDNQISPYVGYWCGSFGDKSSYFEIYSK